MTTADFQLEAQDNCISTSSGTTDDARASLENLIAEREWFMFIALRTRPRCFGCGGRLLSKTVRIQANYALCERCDGLDNSFYRPFWNALRSRGCTDELTTSRGIIFWTPPTSLPEHDAYLRWHELREIAGRTDPAQRSDPPLAP